MCRDVIIILLAKLLVIYCCSPNYLRQSKVKTTTKSTRPPPVGPGPESKAWSGVGWGRPPGADKHWGKGGKNKPEDPNGPDDPDLQNKPFLPDSWKAMGPPFEGASPPDWAYFPKNVGRPSLCFQPPLSGVVCPKGKRPYWRPRTRYAFNPFVDKCQPFPYSGCRQNENNFKSEKRCNDVCQEVPPPDCDPNGDSVEMKDLKAAMYG